MEQIKITVDPATGETKIEVIGVEGSGCLGLTEEIEKAFNGKISNENRQLKKSFYNRNQNLKGVNTDESFQQNRAKN